VLLGTSNPELEILKLAPLDEDLMADEDDEASSDSDVDEETKQSI